MADRALHQSNLLWIRLGSTVPRLVEIRNGRAIARGFAGDARQSGAIVRQRADRVEDRAARRGESRSDQRRDLTVEIVDTRIRMRPAIRHRLRIERADVEAHLVDARAGAGPRESWKKPRG